MLSQRSIFLLWLPLAATWLMMATEGPILAAIVARLPDPKLNLAAYGVAFSIALIVEAPIMMILSASTALVQDHHSYVKLRNFTFSISLALTVSMGLVSLPLIFYPLAINLVGLPLEVVELSYWAILFLLPWPGAIGYRRFYQGLLIRSHRTRLITIGTVIRLLTMTLVSFSLFKSGLLSGASVASASLSSGILVEAIASRLMVRSTLKELNLKHPSTNLLNYPAIAKFYFPLALTSFLALGSQPLITFFVGHSREALSSLAVLPVVYSLVFLFRSQGLALQEVVVALAGRNWEGYHSLSLFTKRLALITSAGLMLIAFTPLQVFWFQRISNLSTDLSELAVKATQILFLAPALAVFLSFLRGLLVKVRHTQDITWASLLELIIILGTLLINIFILDLVGTVSAALAVLAGRASSWFYLWYKVRQNKLSS